VTLRRLGYRLAYRVLQVLWLITRPQKLGVKCVLTDGDRILCVRHTYGIRGWDLPGGGVRRREAPASAAAREMQEELGVCAVEWTELGVVRVRQEYRHDTIHLFAAELGPQPALKLDLGELAAAQWFPRDALPVLSPLSREILRHLPPTRATA
jgi:8-oxo-dGTP pyrophosphatase MutT (NUDIX family)